jgi:hypothetical protein
MNTNTKNPGRAAKILGFLGIGLCGLCCALPVIGIIGGASILGVIALYAEKIALVILILSVAAFAIAYYRKRKSPTCKLD